jgi:gliding motility-associated-like protein
MYYIPDLVIFSQYTTKDNYTGAWETPTSWIPTWPAPQTTNVTSNISIYGYITRNGNLTFPDNTAALFIADTLVIIGDLTFGHNDVLTITDNGIFIIRGNLIIDDDVVIMANGYLVVTGNIVKVGGNSSRQFTSNDNPVKVFIGGTIDPALQNNPDYPVLKCTAPSTFPYPNSGCSYGNMTDIINNPISQFFQSTCPSGSAGSNGPVCTGNTINLTSSGGTIYRWTGPNDFTSTAQNPSRTNAVTAMAGTYTVTVTTASGCTVVASTYVTVNPTPTVVIANPAAVCSPSTLNITVAAITTGSTAGLTYTYWTNAEATTVYATPAAATSGTYYIKGTTTSGCYDIKPVIVSVNPLPLVTITSSSSPMCENDLRTLTGNPSGGTFSVIGGPGSISGNVLSATAPGKIVLKYNYMDICSNTASQSIIVNVKPVAFAGLDQELKFVFETLMAADLSSAETGEWSLISGSCQISDIHSPTTKVTGLKIGENKFLWTVRNGSCEKSDEIIVTVYDLFVPSVITPNGDGKNDYFKISALVGRVNLIIFNRWGNVEYSNSNYLNDWDGRNDKGSELPGDTYFYILNFENGLAKTGTVLITR